MTQGLTIQDKALRVIDALSSDCFCEDIEMGRKVKPEDTELIGKKFAAIYRYAHAAEPNHSCYSAHTDWRDEIKKVYRQMRRNKIL